MDRRARAWFAIAAAVLAAAAWMWWSAATPAEREIRRRLDALAGEFNAGPQEGLAAIARAARLGQYFTEDVVVDLGGGSAPIAGRETLIGMAMRLQPRTAAYTLRFEDLTMEASDAAAAQFSVTALLRQRASGTGQDSLDAREFSADAVKSDGEWRVRRLAAIDTLR
jgi:hypothetical protein